KNPEVDLFPFAGMTPHYLKETLGEASIQFQNHRTQEKDYEIKSVQLKTTATLAEFIQKLEDEPESNDFYLTSNNMGHHLSVFKPLWTQRPLFPEFLDPTLIEKDRAVPSFWFGPKGTMTQMHQDITNSFYVQVYGSKKFYLISPFQTPYMYHHQNFFSPLDIENLDLLSYPLAKKLKVIECTVNPGEILFIPLGWWHQVRSLEISIAMSFTNFRRKNYFEPFSTVYGHKEHQVNLALMQLLRE
ncbi:MAG: cupin-like domain-containing protein, partial [Cyanobacteria bacterium]|nr:cupin-like domain-containing protein [Cyanobacteriota bacterium]